MICDPLVSDKNKNQKRIEAKKHKNKHAKALYKPMYNATHSKTMKNRNRIDVKLQSCSYYFGTLQCFSTDTINHK